MFDNVIVWVLIGVGAWLVIDGFGSIVVYQAQSRIEHAVRVVRVVVGLVLFWLGMMRGGYA